MTATIDCVKRFLPLRWTGFALLVFFGCRTNPIPPPQSGPAWVAFRNPTTPKMRCNRINALTLAEDGTMWIATDSGVTSFRRSSWGDIHDSVRYRISGTGSDTNGYAVNVVATGYDGSLWLGTGGGGVKRVRLGAASEGWITYLVPTIPDNKITTMTADQARFGEVWVGAPLFGFGRFVPDEAVPIAGTWTIYTALEVPVLGSNQVRASAFNARDTTFWFSTLLGVASHSASSGWKGLTFPLQYESTVFAIAFDNSNTVWFGQEEGATSFREPNVWGRYTSVSSGGKLPPGKVNAVATDNYRTRWFGTNGGLASLRDTVWGFFSSASVSELRSDTVTALAYDGRGNLWVGTTNGLAVYNDAGVTF